MHWRDFKTACLKNGSWDRGVPVPKPELPHWTYENEKGEAELAAAVEAQERE